MVEIHVRIMIIYIVFILSIVFVISFVGVSSKPSPIYGGLGLIVDGSESTLAHHNCTETKQIIQYGTMHDTQTN